MNNFAKSAFVVAALALASTAAHAQNECRGKVFIDSVYQTASTGGQFEYFVQARNATAGNISFTITLKNFNRDVTLFSPVLPGVRLNQHASQKIRFGKGTSQNINSGSVSVVYDNMAPRANQPYIAVSGCHAQ